MIHYFAQGTYESVTEGLKYLSKSIKYIAFALDTCEAFTESEDLDKIISVFSDTDHLKDRIKLAFEEHGIEMVSEGIKAMSAMKDGRFEDAGKDVGVMVRIIAIETKPTFAVSLVPYDQWTFDSLSAFLYTASSGIIQDSELLRIILGTFDHSFIRVIKATGDEVVEVTDTK